MPSDNVTADLESSTSYTTANEPNAFASAGSEMATKGVRNPLLLKALRLGMSPRTLMLGSRFLGLPGLALTAGMWGYDKWKNRD